MSPSHIVDNLILPINYPPGNQHIPYQGMFEDDFLFPKVGYGLVPCRKKLLPCISRICTSCWWSRGLGNPSFRKFSTISLFWVQGNLILTAWHWFKKTRFPYTKNQKKQYLTLLADSGWFSTLKQKLCFTKHIICWCFCGFFVMLLKSWWKNPNEATDFLFSSSGGWFFGSGILTKRHGCIWNNPHKYKWVVLCHPLP